MILSILLCLLSITGYYSVYKGFKTTSYIIFIIQNVISYIVLKQYYMVINIGFSLTFLIKIYNDRKNSKN